MDAVDVFSVSMGKSTFIVLPAVTLSGDSHFSSFGGGLLLSTSSKLKAQQLTISEFMVGHTFHHFKRVTAAPITCSLPHLIVFIGNVAHPPCHPLAKRRLDPIYLPKLNLKAIQCG